MNVVTARTSASRVVRLASLIGLLVVGATYFTPAIAYIDPESQYKTSLTQAQTIDPIGSFGEQLSLRAGTLSFRNVDIEVPGTGPNIRIVRTAQLEDGQGTRTSSGNAVSGWEIEIPRIKTITADPLPAIKVQPLSATSPRGWQVSAPDKNARCTHFGVPANVTYSQSTVAFFTHEWWFGYQLVDENGNEQPLIGRSTELAGQQYKIGTSENWVIACLPATANGEPGEAFLAIAPDGTKYWFNYLTYSGYEDLIQVFENQPPKGYDLNYSLPRKSASMLVTRIEDRFGNWVNYSYNGAKLAAITASDGRSVAFSWQGDSVTVTVGTAPNTRVWIYGPGNGYSMQVTQPDGSYWGYAGQFSMPLSAPYEFAGCSQATVFPLSGSRDVSVRAPSGATAAFHLDRRFFGRSYALKACGKTPNIYDGDPGFSLVPKLWIGYALTTKTVSGPGLSTQSWTYAYSAHNGSWQSDCPTPTSCASTVWTQVTEPDGDRTVSHFSNKWDQTENKLVREETYSPNNALLRAVDYTYATTPSNAPNPYPWPLKVGTFADLLGNDEVTLRWTPLKRKTVTQQGASFVWEANSYDAWARTASVTRSSTLGYSRTDVSTYYNDLIKWVIGQSASSTNTNTGLVESQTDYGSNALPLRTYAFGKLQQTFFYNVDGTLGTVKDGNNHTTAYANWKRGIPQTITFADTTSKSAAVDDLGQITSVTDEIGAKTCYGYDTMGRVNRITYPSEDPNKPGVCNQDNWFATTIAFAPSVEAKYGLPANHWRRTEAIGNARKITFYDAMWRPVVQEAYDLADTGNTLTQTVTRYDADGQVVYASYPQRNMFPAVYNTWADPAQIPNALGTWATYDALGRAIQVQQNSEHGLLTTTTEHLSGFQTRHTDARGQQTTTSYMAYDQPTTDWVRTISHPEGAYTYIERDVFGKPRHLARTNADLSQWSGRYYAYDPYQRLCKQTELETGTTAFGYDDAGNVIWSATALPWSPTAPCEYGPTDSQVTTRRVDRLYDARNRLTDLSFRDGNGNQHWTYTHDGLPNQVTTWNDGGTQTVTNTYQYNKRRLLNVEQMGQLGGATWALTYGYDASGNLAAQMYPTGLTVSYAPNALGQATQLSSAGQLYASGIQYYPNGGIQQFTYGNGIVHTLAQNARQLPQTSTDSGGVLRHGYSYDYNGNVTQIMDLNRGGDYSRWMTYDGLNRLKSAGSCSFNATTCWFYYDYDVLDNLTRVRGADGSDRYYCYDGRQQLTNIKSGPCSGGASVVGLGYDERGNLNNKNGQAYVFDHGNRLRAVPGQEDTYRYDAHGRRVLSKRAGGLVTVSMYSQAGQRLYEEYSDQTSANEYIYLAGSLLAARARNWLTNVTTLRYQHTDALGTPVAETDATGTVVQRSEYDPYGRLNNRPLTDGPGYTGHYQDAATGLTYMQQRYYDPQIGRFLSMDPVTADANTGSSFNRYWYANNNPYKFVDPDGRQACCNQGPVQSFEELGDRMWNSIDSGIFHTAGQAMAADTAFFVGVATDNQALQNSAIEGMRDNITSSDGVSAVMIAVSPRGTPGEGGAGLSPRAAAREAMRQEGIPTSQQARSQSSPRGPGNKPAGRERVYDTPNGQKRLQHQLQDTAHGPHWEAGKAKAGGQTDPAGRPRLTNDKKKVDE